MLEAHKFDLSDRVLTFNDYKFNRNPPSNVGLFDKMVCYFDGYHRKVVPLDVVTAFPIIHDKYMTPDEKITDLTVAVCPFTLAAGVFDGKYTATPNVENSCLVITDGDNTFPIVAAPRRDATTGRDIKKYEVDIKLLRNVFTEYPDCRYLVVTDNKKQDVKPIVGPKYYDNNEILFKLPAEPAKTIHPKTLVYLIEYTSSKNRARKASVVIGKDAGPNEPSGYNVVQSGVYDYLIQSDDKIKEKSGFVTPILWFAWKSFFPEARIVNLG
jgi:hypothetical protein